MPVSHQKRLVQSVVGAQGGNCLRRYLRVQPHLVKEAPRRHFGKQEAECGHSDQQKNRSHQPAAEVAHADASVIAARLDAAAFAEASSFLVATCCGLEIICWVGPTSTACPPDITAITSANRATSARSWDIRRQVSERAAGRSSS